MRFILIWQGSDIPSEYTEPLDALGPLSSNPGIVETPELNSIGGAAYGTPLCGKGLHSFLLPVGAKSYNVTAFRKAFDLFAAFPPWLQNSAMMLEGYNTEGVHLVPAETTAYPERSNELLLATIAMYEPSPEEPNRHELALGLAEEVRSALVEGHGAKLYAYVNYAYGNEEKRAVYGYETWRQEKLQRLKKRWDPESKFEYFLPLN